MLKRFLPAALSVVLCSCGSDGSAPNQNGIVRATIYGADSWGGVVGPLEGVAVTVGSQTELTNDLGIAYLSQAPGARDVRVDRPGSELVDTLVVVVTGDTVDLIQELAPFRPTTGRVQVLVAVPEAPGSPLVIFPQGAIVMLGLNGRQTDQAGRADFPFAPVGTSWLRVSYSGAIPDSTLVTVQGGDTVSVTMRLELAPPP